MKPTFDIPFGSNSTSAKITSPAEVISSVPSLPDFNSTTLTLSHKVLQVVPLNIVREIANVDSAVLLRGFTNIRHHLLASHSPFFIGSMLCRPAVSRCRTSSWRCSCSTHGSTISATAVFVATIRSTTWRIGPPAGLLSGASGTSTR